jgi:transcriptional regulator with XRE-family HTH domain
MATVQRTRDIGRREAQRLLQRLGTELRDARLAAGASQRRLAEASGVSQPVISRIERAERGPTLDAVTLLAAALGQRLSVKLFPTGSPVRDAAQLRLIVRFRSRLTTAWGWATEVLVGMAGDQQAGKLPAANGIVVL